MSNYIEDQIDAAFAGHGWPAGKDAPALLMDAACELKQLRGNLSLAEEGLANYAQENERLKSALQKIAAYDPGKFRPLEDEIAIWRLSTEALSESSREPQTQLQSEKT